MFTTFTFLESAICLVVLLLHVPLRLGVPSSNTDTESCPVSSTNQSPGISHPSDCCQYMYKVKDLYTCLSDYLIQQHNPNLQHRYPILVATYISTGIQDYASYFLLNNAIYSHYQGYPMKVLTDESDNYAPDDRRWNKIPAIRDGLSSWAKLADYVVFMDADLMVINHALNLTHIILQYPEANIILGEDALDFGNSGFLIVKNSLWSKRFLDRWWSMKDRTPHTFCDQHVLNKLSVQLEEESNLYPYVQLVPSKQFNSIWPPIETFNHSDSVLHMLGEFSTTRVTIGKAFMEKLCPIVSSNSGKVTDPLKNTVIKKSLLSKEELETSKTNAVKIRFYEHLHKINEHSLSSDRDERQNYIDDYEEMLGIIEHMCDSTIRTGKNIKLCESFIKKANLFLNKRLADLERIYRDKLEERIYRDGHRSIGNDISESSFLLSVRDIQYSLQFYNMTLIYDIGEMMLQSQKVLESFDQLVQNSGLVDLNLSENKIYAHKFRGKIFLKIAGRLVDKKRFKLAIRYLMVSISEFSAALEQFSKKNIGSSDFQEMVMFYIEAAISLSKSYYFTDEISGALEWLQIANTNAIQLKSEYQGEERLLMQLYQRIMDVEVMLNRTSLSSLKYYAQKTIN